MNERGNQDTIVDQSFFNIYKEIVLEKECETLGTIKEHKLKQNAIRLGLHVYI